MAEQTLEEISPKLEKKVTDYLKLCGNCAQTTFVSLQEQFNLEDGGVVKALTPFPGIALRGETCGAVTGSLMAIGLVYGRDKENLGDWQGYLNSLPPSRRFCQRFEQSVGSTMCGDIIEKEFDRRFNLADRREAFEWMQCGALEKCGSVIQRAVLIAAEVILKNE